MNELAIELNSALEGSAAGFLLSSLGRRLFFPRGIVAQAAEARKTAKINATLGIAFHGGKPLFLPSLAKQLPGLTPEEAVTYAPTAGIEAFRKAWKGEILRKNPSLKDGDFTLPVVAPGITAGITYISELFLDEGQTMLMGDPSWENYSLIFAERRGAVVKEIPLFSGGGLNLAAFEKALKEEAKTGAIRLILNFPNNPSGYTPQKVEVDALADMIKNIADSGVYVLLICDDAYFGLFYEDDIMKESIFTRFASLHEKVLAVKIDGPTKEDYVWGLRTAFISFGTKALNAAAQEALERKLMGAIRSSVSCSNTPAQNLTLKTWADPAIAKEKETFYKMLLRRYQAVERFLKENPIPSGLEALPFNSGYFMSFRCKNHNAEDHRQLLLKKGIGTIALGTEYLRVTFAAIEEEDINSVYRALFEVAVELAR
jgi:aspartate/methionine/tyrosine aminotransferase